MATVGVARPQAEVVVEKESLPVKVWGTIGGIILVFQAYVMIKWVTGPYFESVDPGPSDAPDWMMVSLRTMEVLFVALWAWCVWHFVVQPWRKERRFSTNGLLCMALFVFAWFQDPLANYGGAVFTYNSNLVNMGSWLNEVPGVVTVGLPGAQLSEPLWTAAIYPGVIFVLTLAGAAFMRKVKGRFPAMSKVSLVLWTYLFFICVDVVLEGFILMPLGAYTYAGAPDWISFNDDHFYKYTLIEGIGFGAVWTCWSSLIYFKDDQGNTVVERGVEKLKWSQPRKDGLRFLAIGAFISITMVACVNIPFYWQATHTSAYPDDVQKRSYFTQGMCGEGTNTACFDADLPIPRENRSARVAPDGTLAVPEGTEIPKVVPIDRGPLGPGGD